ncbi:MAG: L-glutamate gamma-semialdehyde dehydrogenase [Candidatus Kapaibacterium sp.]
MDLKPFENLTPYDFSDPEIAKKQKEAIDKVRSQFGKEYPNIIDGERVFTQSKTESYNPAHPKELVGLFQRGLQRGGAEDAEAAIQAAYNAFDIWRYTRAEDRAEFLLKAAEVCRQRRLEINAWMIAEVGKNYAEADADTCEAIDFLEFYAREAIRYSEPQPLTPYPGEKNEYFYVPLGVGICIPPWNFPFAIMVGITSAAIAAGNTVVMKPSSDAPMMGYLFADIMHEVGLPKGVLNFFVASGAEAGDYLVKHPHTRFISFTGSMEVGLRINELAAQTPPEQIWIKRVIAEMGGKDTIIVDSEADIDAAVHGVMVSAFGFQGQKCSACSRAVVDKMIYDEFCEKLVEATRKLESGDPVDNYYCGPVVNERAEASILSYIEIGKEEGKLILGGEKVKDMDGFFIQPTIIKDIAPDARISQEEIFGPVLAILKAEDYDNALEIANNTIYGLTGSVYSENRYKLNRARSEFHVGNLYFNRKSTGAVVDVHPFGGFNMSGTDSKAGSRDYLSLFMQGKAISEKVK